MVKSRIKNQISTSFVDISDSVSSPGMLAWRSWIANHRLYIEWVTTHIPTAPLPPSNTAEQCIALIS